MPDNPDSSSELRNVPWLMVILAATLVTLLVASAFPSGPPSKIVSVIVLLVLLSIGLFGTQIAHPVGSQTRRAATSAGLFVDGAIFGLATALYFWSQSSG